MNTWASIIRQVLRGDGHYDGLRDFPPDDEELERRALDARNLEAQARRAVADKQPVDTRLRRTDRGWGRERRDPFA